MKTCKDCHKEKNDTDFYGVQGDCKECTKARVRANYNRNRSHYIEYERERWKRPERRKAALEYQRNRRKRHPGKNRARQYINNAIRDGRIVRKPCEVCGEVKVEAHHTDYRSPANVTWLCRLHHLEAEGKKSYSNNINL